MCGYYIHEHYDRENWNDVESVSAQKLFDDGSFDYFSVYHVPKSAGSTTLSDHAKYLAKKRTCEDIISDHYTVLLARVRDWNENGLQTIRDSRSAFESGDVKHAIYMLQNLERPAYPATGHWLDSLKKHLSRMAVSMEN